MRAINSAILRSITRAQSVMATRDRGATAVEYGLMVALIAVAIIVTVGLVGDQLNTLFGEVKTGLTNA